MEGKYTFTDRQPTCYTGMDQSLGERAHEDARMGWIQESRASINRALQSALWKQTKSRASTKKKVRLDYPRTSLEMRDSPRSLGNEDGEALGRRRIKSPARPELRGLPKKTSLPSVMRQPCKLGPGCVQRKTDFFGVYRGPEKPAAPKDGT